MSWPRFVVGLTCCCTPANCAISVVNWSESIGELGSWFCSWVVSMVRNELKLPAMEASALDAVEEAVLEAESVLALALAVAALAFAACSAAFRRVCEERMLPLMVSSLLASGGDVEAAELPDPSGSDRRGGGVIVVVTLAASGLATLLPCLTVRLTLTGILVAGSVATAILGGRGTRAGRVIPAAVEVGRSWHEVQDAAICRDIGRVEGCMEVMRVLREFPQRSRLRRGDGHSRAAVAFPY